MNYEVANLKKSFDDYKHIDEYGREFWYAHELCKAMGYTQYQNFKPAIERAIQSMIASGVNPNDHLMGSHEMVQIGSGAVREIDGYILDKYASYLVAMNSDPSKQEVAFAQVYFLQSTATIEALEERLYINQTIINRNFLRDENKKLNSTLGSHDIHGKEYGIIESKGDEGYLNQPTREFKETHGIPLNRAIGDFLGSDMGIGKAAAQMLARRRIINEDARGVKECSKVVYEENRFMRNAIIDKLGAAPEELATYEDCRKLESKYNKETKKLLKDMYMN